MDFIIKWFAKIGAVGSTARWGAKLYKSYKEIHPNISDSKIYQLMIVDRYQNMPKEGAIEYLRPIAKDEELGLRALVTSILEIEADFNENTSKYQHLFIQVIEEELERKGLDKEVIRGY